MKQALIKSTETRNDDFTAWFSKKIPTLIIKLLYQCRDFFLLGYAVMPSSLVSVLF